MRPASIAWLLLLKASFATACGAVGDDEPTDDEIRQLIIDDSIAAYKGPCPCPYNLAADGKKCGERSAYSRKAGDAPLCKPEDVSDDMVNAYRENH